MMHETAIRTRKRAMWRSIHSPACSAALWRASAQPVWRVLLLASVAAGLAFPFTMGVPQQPTIVQASALHTATAPPDHYLVLLPGVCPDKAIDQFTDYLGAIQCEGTTDPTTPLSAKARATDTFQTLLKRLPKWNVIPFSYKGGGQNYSATDTQQPLKTSAKVLDQLLTAQLCKDPQATFDLVGHSLGGAVAAYWIVQDGKQAHPCAKSNSPVDLLAHIHSLVTFDSPLQGLDPNIGKPTSAWWLDNVPTDLIAGLALNNQGAVAKSLLALFTNTVASQVGRDLSASGTKSVLQRLTSVLPGKVLAIGNYDDTFIGAGTTWAGASSGASYNRFVTDCSDHDFVCHSSVLRNADALEWAANWITSSTPSNALARPGGIWSEPWQGSFDTASITRGDPPLPLNLAAEVYSPGQPLATVWFTYQAPAGTGQWRPLCQAELTTYKDDQNRAALAHCQINLAQFNPPQGPMRISFDVYTQYVKQCRSNMAQCHLSPNGERVLSYQPPPAPPAPPTQAPVPPTHAIASPSATPEVPQPVPTPSMNTPVPQPVIPGGMWVGPGPWDANGLVQDPIQDVVHFAAEAYPTNQGDPPIAFVNFTLGWPAPNPNNWIIACTVHSPSGTGPDGRPLYSCDVPLSTVNPQPPAGQLRISFDVYDQQYQNGDTDHYTLAPNGEHTITYQPQPPTQTELLTLNPASGPAGSTVCLTWTDDTDNPGGSGTISFDNQQIGTYQSDPSTENWSGCLQIPTDAQPGQHTITLHESSDQSSGSASFTVTGATTSCGQQLGQHCIAIWTPQSSYHIGQPLQLCYSVAGPSYVVITDYPPDGSHQVIDQGNDDGSGGCLSGSTNGPVGQERVHLDVYTQQGGSLLGSADTSFQVLQ